MSEATATQQHLPEVAGCDGILCSLICLCGEELCGVTWQQAGAMFDRHIIRAALATEEGR